MRFWPKRLQLRSAVHKRHGQPATHAPEHGRDQQSGPPRESARKPVSRSKVLRLPRPRSAWLARALTAELSHKGVGQNPLWPCVERHSAYCSALEYLSRHLVSVRNALDPVQILILPPLSFCESYYIFGFSRLFRLVALPLDYSHSTLV